MRALAFFLGALAGSAAVPDRAWQWRSSGTRAALDLEPVALPPVSVPAVAVGAFALGAFAVGALAIGALAIGRLEVRKARLREVEIDSLTVRCFKVTEEPAGEPDSAES
jgi:hypothetical protein